jgi:hypothetical protein
MAKKRESDKKFRSFSEDLKSIKRNAAGMASGMYFYRINAGEFTATKKLVLLK